MAGHQDHRQVGVQRMHLGQPLRRMQAGQHHVAQQHQRGAGLHPRARRFHAAEGGDREAGQLQRLRAAVAHVLVALDEHDGDAVVGV